jgi:hypothetical protein
MLCWVRAFYASTTPTTTSKGSSAPEAAEGEQPTKKRKAEQSPKKKSNKKAVEIINFSDGTVSVQLLCKVCRKSSDSTIQTQLPSFFISGQGELPLSSMQHGESDEKEAEAPASTFGGAIETIENYVEGDEKKEEEQEVKGGEKKEEEQEEDEENTVEFLTCAQCRRPLQERPRQPGRGLVRSCLLSSALVCSCLLWFALT